MVYRGPYRRVDKETGVVTDEIVYMTADEEDEYVIAQQMNHLMNKEDLSIKSYYKIYG